LEHISALSIGFGVFDNFPGVSSSLLFYPGVTFTGCLAEMNSFFSSFYEGLSY
jgi:hypothetical protein